MAASEVFTLHFSNDKTQVIIHNKIGPLFTIARNQGGKWVVDTTELFSLSISPIKMMLQVDLHNTLNNDPFTSEEKMNYILNVQRQANFV